MAGTAWEVIERWYRSPRSSVEVLGPDTERRDVVVNDLGIDPDSTVAQVILHTGGAFVDHGWFRLLGSGHPRMKLGLDDWNGARGKLEPWRAGEVFVVAHDVVGGFFAMDSGALGFGRGRVVYLAPDSVQWEDMEMGYSAFLRWLAQGDVAGFAGDHRWPGWEEDVAALDGDQGFFVAPPLWAEGPPMPDRSRVDVPMTQLWTYAHQTMERLEGVPEGSPVRFRPTDVRTPGSEPRLDD
jgi:hypothetical protein